MVRRDDHDFRRFFVRGLAVVLPTLLTLMIIVWVVGFVQKWFGQYINAGIILLLNWALPHVAEEQLWALWEKYWILNGIGFVLAIIGVYFVGRLAASFIGKSVWATVEHGLMRAPVIRQIYPSVKQVTDFVFTEKKGMRFSRVVAVEYPRKGAWSLGFVTGPGMAAMGAALESDLLTVFVPSSPTPVTGYVLTVRREEVIDLPLTIDEVVRFVVSCGVVIPPAHESAAARADTLALPAGDGKTAEGAEAT